MSATPDASGPPPHRHRTAAVAGLCAVLLAACGAGTSAEDPTEAPTGVPLLEGTADPAASPTAPVP